MIILYVQQAVCTGVTTSDNDPSSSSNLRCVGNLALLCGAALCGVGLYGAARRCAARRGAALCCFGKITALGAPKSQTFGPPKSQFVCGLAIGWVMLDDL